MRVIACGLVLALSVTAAHGGESLSVRLVEASPGPKQVDARLRDVSSVLTPLPFSSFTVVSSRSTSLPASQPIGLDGYSLTLNGTAKNLTLRLMHGGRLLIETGADVSDGRPWVYGGLPHPTKPQSKLLLILKLRK